MARIDWSQYDHLLGTICDTHLARQIGCRSGTVVHRRETLAITPFVERTRWKQDDYALFELGNIKCHKCGEIKPISAFTKNKSAIKGYRKECTDCHQAVIKNRRRKIKQKWTAEMGSACQHCGFDKWIGPLQFHHIDWKWANRNKENTYPNIVLYRKYDEAQIRAELDKCCLLCSNCHDAVHSGEINPVFVKRESLGWTVDPREDGSLLKQPD